MSEVSLVERIMQLEERIDQDEELIRWLARTYGDNDPIFPFESTVTDVMTGQTHTIVLEVAQRMADTWQRVVRYAT